jgi:hypothetical protein
MLDESISDCIHLFLHQLHRRAFAQDAAALTSRVSGGSQLADSVQSGPTEAGREGVGAVRGEGEEPRQALASDMNGGNVGAGVVGGGGAKKTSSLAQLAPMIANVFPSILSARSPHSPFHAALKGPSRETCRVLSIAEF